MSDVAIRLVVVAAVVVVAGAVGMLARRLSRPRHGPLDLSGVDLPPGIVVFTSTACPGCKPALRAAEASGAPVREVSWDLEPHLQERAGVESVPLTVVLDRHGRVVAQFAGTPPVRALRRAAARL